MKSIVIYYSHDGNTAMAANKIATLLGADVLKLMAKKTYPTGKFSKYLWGGKSVIFNDKPELLPYHFDAQQYDTIILGSPVWAGSFAPPMASFLQANSLAGKKVGLLACHGGGGGEKCFQKFQALLPSCEIVAKVSLKNPLATSQNPIIQESILKFCDSFAQ